MRDNYNLHNCVAYYRKLNQLSQSDLGMAVGVSKNTISAIETGDKETSVFIALAIASVLDVPVQNLFYLASF